jgi:hypothetical protein
MRSQSTEKFWNANTRDCFGFVHAIEVCRSNPPGFHDQQDDPPDERERADDWRDEVAVSCLDVQAEKINRLARG